MRHLDKRWMLGLAFAAAGTGPAVLAQNPVDDAASWLASVQDPSGSWGAAFEFVDTSTVVETLAALAPGGSPLADGAAWLAGALPANHQEIGRRVDALADVDGFQGAAGAEALSLLGLRNPVEFDTLLPNWPEGGWGVAPGFETDCLTSALALLALESAGLAAGISVEDEALPAGNNVHEWTIAAGATKARILITVVDATVRLRMKQGSIPTNMDPFFELAPGTFLIVFPDSGLAFTAGQNFIKVNATGSPASYSFTASYETPELDTRAFGEALDYLEESQNGDGGWGIQRGMTSDFFTSLYALLALQAYPGYDVDAERAGGLAYVLAEQLAGGGFGFDGVNPLSQVTALAALNLVRSESFPFSTATNDAIAALLTLQDPGGSWDFEPFHTALSMRSLWEHNQPPTADAGPDQIVVDSDADGFASVTLSGSGSDADGFVAGLSWTEEGVEIATGSTPTVPLAVGEHDVTLTVKDDGGRTTSDVVHVTVQCSTVTALSCGSSGADVDLDWSNPESYLFFNVSRDGMFLDNLPPGTTSFTDVDVDSGSYLYEVEAICAGLIPGPRASCMIVHVAPCSAVTGLSCSSAGLDVQLSWTNNDTYDDLNVYRDGELIATLPGADVTFSEADVPSGNYTYTVEGVCTGANSAPGVDCEIAHTNPCDRSTYCTNKISSSGCVPMIESSGLPTLSGPDDFSVNATEIEGATTGFLVWGLRPNPAASAGGGPAGGINGAFWLSPQGARICVLDPTFGANQASGGTPGSCDGTLSFAFTQAFMAGEGFAVGTSVHAQFLFRDGAHPDGSGLGHTAGLRFTVCP